LHNNYKHLPIYLAAMPLILASAAYAQPAIDTPQLEALGGAGFDHWTGLKASKDGSAELAGSAEFRYPDGPRGFYNHGFRRLNDGTRDWRNAYGVQFEARLPSPAARTITVSILRPDGATEPVKATVVLQGAGWHTVTLPWSAFDIETARTAYLLHVKGLRISTGVGTALTIRDPRVTMGAEVSLSAAVQGMAVKAGDTAEYDIVVGNSTRKPLAVSLGMVRYGWEQMGATVSPALVSLRPGETRKLTVRVNVAANIPQGGHERQMLQAIPNGNVAAAARMELVTASAFAGPHVLFNPVRWDEIRSKVGKYSWAREEQDNILKAADAWNVPAMGNAPDEGDDTKGRHLIPTAEAQGLLANGIAWQLTRDRKYAEKVALFMRRLSDPRTGYPHTYRASNQALVQEGHLFQHIAMAYDMVRDAGVITPADRTSVEHTFRLLMETMDRARLNGNINNWTVSEITGALYCALAIGDFAEAERFFKGPSGILDQLAKGTMDDGWWNEASISYNTWVASEFTQTALALENWGINFKDMWVPASYSPHVLLDSELAGGAPAQSGRDYRPFGMTNEVWGPNRQSYRTIKDLWNSLLPFLDYRGVMFGVNDSTENKVGGYRHEIGATPFELAYYAFGDPSYAAVVKTAGGKRDLLYGVPELPEHTPAESRDNAVADNVGLVMLRSQTPGRGPREQIQSVLHYGSHGWAHGHFDRTGLLSLMRYGRSLYNPEAAWWGYPSFMYKFYVQTSLSHNMVVVDQKMQEASPASRTLFHSGKLMQATAVETTARWSNPPYGGMVYGDTGISTFEDKAWREGKQVPMPKDAPAYGALTGYTEPILQRRVMVLTDDYVVLADYVKGDRPHVYDNLFQLKGFLGLEAPQRTLVRHDKQWSADPLGSAQFVTDVDWFTAAAPARATFDMRFGPGADNAGTRALYSENGPLKLDVHTVYPLRQNILLGAVPEDHRTDKRLFYTVRGDGKALAEGKFGAWILGEDTVDVPLAGVRQLELETRTEQSKANTVFWANARVVTRSGEEIPLSQLPVTYQNIVMPAAPGQDYYGGPIKIVGTQYGIATAGEPRDAKQPGKVRIDLTRIDAARFKSVVGGDYPLGDESQRRKTYGVRQEGRDARFLTLIEPYEDKRMIKSVLALDANRLAVTLMDGRTQEIELSNVDGNGSDIGVKVVERRGGKVVREERTGHGTSAQ
jgi:hypothetical protein